jgi:hypothetical protein
MDYWAKHQPNPHHTVGWAEFRIWISPCVRKPWLLQPACQKSKKPYLSCFVPFKGDRQHNSLCNNSKDAPCFDPSYNNVNRRFCCNCNVSYTDLNIC